jgi:hypothetical protein
MTQTEATTQLPATVDEPTAPPAEKPQSELDRMLAKDVTWRAPTAQETARDAGSLFQVADTLFAGGVCGAKVTQEQARAIVLAGYELGWTPMYALGNLAVSKDGRLGMSALAMRALFLQRVPGAKLNIDATPERCIITGWRPGWEDWKTATWTQQDSDTAGLKNEGSGQNGKYTTTHGKYPSEMKCARCTTRWMRWYVPDVLGPVSYTVDELDEGTAPPAPRPAQDAAATQEKTRDERKAEGQQAEPKKPAKLPVHVAYGLWAGFANVPNDKNHIGDFRKFAESVIGGDLDEDPRKWAASHVEAIRKDLDLRGDPRPVDQREPKA